MQQNNPQFQPQANMPQGPIPATVGNAPNVPSPVGSPPRMPMPGGKSASGGKKKKFVIVFAVVLMVILVLFGALAAIKKIIGNKPTQTSGEVTLTWWGFWDDKSVIDPLIKEYESQNPNVKINYETQSHEAYRERLTSSLARGKGPDIFRIHNTWVPMFTKDLAALPSDVMTSQEYEDTFYKAAVDSLTVGKNIVGIPLQYDGLGLFINQDIFTTYGKFEPKSWDQFRKTANDLKIYEGQALTQSGAALGSTVNVDKWEEILAMLFIQNGADLAKPSSDRSILALNYYKLYSQKDKVWDDIQAPSTLAFSTGKLAMMFGDSTQAYEIKDKNPAIKFKVIPVPQLPKFTGEEPDITYASFWAEGVWAKSPAQAEAWKFLKFLTTQENLTKLHKAEELSATVYPEIYPRKDMQQLLANDRYVGGIVKLAPTARTWFMASDTGDGDSGLNTELSKIYKSIVDNPDFETKIDKLDANLPSVLAKYGLR